MTTFLTIFRRFPTTFRRFLKIWQNFSEGQTNILERFPKTAEDFRGGTDDVSIIQQHIWVHFRRFCNYSNGDLKTYMLFTGREVRMHCMGKNCARGLEYQGQGHMLMTYTDRPSPENNIFILGGMSFFWSGERDSNKRHDVTPRVLTKHQRPKKVMWAWFHQNPFPLTVIFR